MDTLPTLQEQFFAGAHLSDAILRPAQIWSTAGAASDVETAPATGVD